LYKNAVKTSLAFSWPDFIVRGKPVQQVASVK